MARRPSHPRRGLAAWTGLPALLLGLWMGLTSAASPEPLLTLLAGGPLTGPEPAQAPPSREADGEDLADAETGAALPVPARVSFRRSGGGRFGTARTSAAWSGGPPVPDGCPRPFRGAGPAIDRHPGVSGPLRC
jgi:hypothetical protein